MTVKFEHLAGLELAYELAQMNSFPVSFEASLEKLIDQAKAASCIDCKGTGFCMSIMGDEIRCPCKAPIQFSKPPSAAVEDKRSALMHWSKSLECTRPVEPDDPEGAWFIGSIDDDGDQTFYPVITVEADQYDAPGDSEKIAKTISALWQQAFSTSQVKP